MDEANVIVQRVLDGIAERIAPGVTTGELDRWAEATIREVGPRLRDFHVADNNRLACGMGALDWPRIVETLEEIGYDGAFSFDHAKSGRVMPW